jgi:hypothetical protein
MNAALAKELFALLLIGEGVVGMLHPDRYLRLWELGPRPFRELIKWCEARPGLLRLVCAAEAGAGLWLALRQLPEVTSEPESELAPTAV